MPNLLTKKIIVIAILALVLLIPLDMILSKISERSHYLEQARASVAQSWTSEQKVVVPILVIPYTTEKKIEVWDKQLKEKVWQRRTEKKQGYFEAARLQIHADITQGTRNKGIYRVPVYNSLISVSGLFSQEKLQSFFRETKKNHPNMVIGQAFIAVSISDTRGINSLPQFNWQGQPREIKPGTLITQLPQGVHSLLPVSLFKENRATVVNPQKPNLNFELTIDLRGMESLSFVPVGSESRLTVQSSWPHPQFEGSFLPVTYNVDQSGYKAEWSTTSFASNISNKLYQCQKAQCDELMYSDFGVKHIEPVDVYLQSERSVKYGLLFIGLSFIAFFIFEIVKKLPIHPIQYALVGVAIAVFYLLLVSLSEHIQFAIAYLVSTLCCVLLLLFYLRYVLQNMRLALAFSAMFSVLYAVLYVIISAEDFAFLMGGLLSFISLVIVMFTTRHINWFEISEQVKRGASRQPKV